MISYKKAKWEDLDGIMEVISDVEISKQEESKKIITERIEQDQLLCVVADNKIIGFLGWDTRFQNNHEYWYLEQITIQKDYRDKGVGQNFVKYFLQICRDGKVKKLYAHVQECNNRSLKMFLNAGGKINTESDKCVQGEITVEFELQNIF
jgi:N-acetylglutamate synthase-like GNAT family acetyltransferase